MTQTTLLLGLSAQTWIHVGSGEKDGVVDLPIQREAHNGWPVIFGSSLKGAMRSAASLPDKDPGLLTLFGPEHFANGSSADKIYAGALMISDARLLWLPVRSLTTHTRYLCCPAILRRLLADMARANQPQNLKIPVVSELNALSAEEDFGDYLYLEEYAFSQQYSPDLVPWCELFSRFCDLGKAEIARQLTVITDDQFAYLCQSAIPLHPHIALDYATKRVVDGALWYEEALPPETLFYTLLAATQARDGQDLSAAQILQQARDRLFGQHPYLQVGGNESTGMGWFKITESEA